MREEGPKEKKKEKVVRFPCEEKHTPPCSRSTVKKREAAFSRCIADLFCPCKTAPTAYGGVGVGVGGGCAVLQRQKRYTKSAVLRQNAASRFCNCRSATRCCCFSAKVTKRAAMPARFVTNEVVTNRAGFAPFFPSHLDISTSDRLCVCVCARACVCLCQRERERDREGKRENQRER